MSENPLATWLAEASAQPPQRGGEETHDPEPPTARASASTPRPGRPPVRRLRRLAAVPWAVAALLALLAFSRGALPLTAGMVQPADGTDPSAVPAEPGATPSVPAVDAVPSPEPAPRTGASPGGAASADPSDGGAETDELGRAARPGDAAHPAGADGHAQITAAAEVAMRLALTGTGGDGDRYVDLVSADGLAWHGDVVVVTASVILLEGTDGEWDRTRAARYAIALRRGSQGLDIVGPPWPIAGTPSAPPPPEGTAALVDDEALAAALVAAVERAGYADVALAGLLPPPGGTILRLRLRASAPGDAAPRDHDLLLDASPPHDVLGTT